MEFNTGHWVQVIEKPGRQRGTLRQHKDTSSRGDHSWNRRSKWRGSEWSLGAWVTWLELRWSFLGGTGAREASQKLRRHNHKQRGQGKFSFLFPLTSSPIFCCFLSLSKTSGSCLIQKQGKQSLPGSVRQRRAKHEKIDLKKTTAHNKHHYSFTLLSKVPPLSLVYFVTACVKDTLVFFHLVTFLLHILQRC